jgi:hypothetical protein
MLDRPEVLKQRSGLTFFAVALNDAMAGRWREVNKPEE